LPSSLVSVGAYSNLKMHVSQSQSRFYESRRGRRKKAYAKYGIPAFSRIENPSFVLLNSSVSQNRSDAAVQRGVNAYDMGDALWNRRIGTTMRYAHLGMMGKKRVILGGEVRDFPLRKKMEEGPTVCEIRASG